MSIVNDARTKFLRSEKERRDKEYAKKKRKKKGWTKGSIWATNVGGCHRKALLRVTGKPGQETFTARSLDYIDMGIEMEDRNADALLFEYGDRLEQQLELRYEMLSGKPDFVIENEDGTVVVVEHKMTSEKHWDSDSKSDLPRHGHIGQAITYMFMYEMLHGVVPEVRIHYKAWGNYAEFELQRQEDGSLIINSDINGILDVFTYKHDFYAEIRELMNWYDATELPPKQEKKWKHCQFAGQKSCGYYDYCWGE